jgi:hypothetical protein
MWGASLLRWGCLIALIALSADGDVVTSSPELASLSEAAAEDAARGRRLAFRGGVRQMGGGGGSTATATSGSSSSGGGSSGFDCSITSCEGLNLLTSIRSDLDLWRKRGGISLADTVSDWSSMFIYTDCRGESWQLANYQIRAPF